MTLPANNGGIIESLSDLKYQIVPPGPLGKATSGEVSVSAVTVDDEPGVIELMLYAGFPPDERVARLPVVCISVKGDRVHQVARTNRHGTVRFEGLEDGEAYEFRVLPFRRLRPPRTNDPVRLADLDQKLAALMGDLCQTRRPLRGATTVPDRLAALAGRPTGADRRPLPRLRSNGPRRRNRRALPA